MILASGGSSSPNLPSECPGYIVHRSMLAVSKSLLLRTGARHPGSELYTIHHADHYTIDAAIRLHISQRGWRWLAPNFRPRKIHEDRSLGQEAGCSGEYSYQVTQEWITHMMPMTNDSHERESIWVDAARGRGR